MKQIHKKTLRKNILNDNSLLTETINEYLDNIDAQEKTILKEELTYNVEFKRDFEKRILEFSLIFGALVAENQTEFEYLSDNFINRPATKNIYILNMYKFYLENFFAEFEKYYGTTKATDIFSGITALINKTNLYHELIETLHNNTKTNQKKIKI